jgi:hypothetical protein
VYAINDALADTIIRSTLDPDPAARARYQPTLHPSAPRTRLDLAIDVQAPLAAARRLLATVTAVLVPAQTPSACCATA